MEASDVKVGRVYRAKKPKAVGILMRYYDDRLITWVSTMKDQIQYDGPTVRMGSKYPTISMKSFLRWANADVTEHIPKNDWQEYEFHCS